MIKNCRSSPVKSAQTARTCARHGWNYTPDIDLIISGKPSEAAYKEITQPYEYLLNIDSNNKNFRFKFLEAINDKFFHIEHELVVEEIGDIIGTLHEASLLIDDIEDLSTVRRGQPCAHVRFGVPSTINCGNYMYFVALEKAINVLPHLWSQLQPMNVLKVFQIKDKIVKILVDEMLNLHRGQGLELYWRDNLHLVISTGLPSIADYLQVIMNKTGGLFRLCVKLLGLFATESVTCNFEALENLANLFGIIYQVRDDYLNLTDVRYSEMKGCAAEDLLEGKLSLPVLHSLLTEKREKSPLLHILLDLDTPTKRSNNPDALRNAVAYLRTGPSLRYTYEILQEYIGKAKALIADHPEISEELANMVAKLGDVKPPVTAPSL